MIEFKITNQMGSRLEVAVDQKIETLPLFRKRLILYTAAQLLYFTIDKLVSNKAQLYSDHAHKTLFRRVPPLHFSHISLFYGN